MQSQNFPFWTTTKVDSVKLNSRILSKFLSDEGFGKFRTTKDVREKLILFRKEDGILEILDPENVSNWLRIYVECSDISEREKDLVIDKIMNISSVQLRGCINGLTEYSEGQLLTSKKLSILKDKKNECFIPFSNGVTRITKEKVELIDYRDLGVDYGIWKSSIKDHEIELYEISERDKQSCFRDYVRYALKFGVTPKKDGNDVEQETDSKEYQEQLSAFETGFGYLIYNHNPADDTRVVVFVDRESSSSKTEGGNGKSVVMDCVKYFNKTSFVDGKLFRKTMSDSSRFNFSNVELDTRFIFLNDINPDFDLTQLFSMITDDLTVEQKGKNKVVIPKESKPKMGITTNYVISGIGNSFERRQHIVEFGNFWNRCRNIGITPKDVIGKLIGDDFNTQDWNDFYNYGFHCIQRYLKDGFITPGNQDYKFKSLVISIEGEKGSGEIVDWIQNWIEEDRLEGNYHKQGIPLTEFYNLFLKLFPKYEKSWDKKRFKEAVWNYVKYMPNLDYNPHLAHKGDSLSDRRDRKGPRGKQDEVITITST
jgi:hypothetical protein